MLWHGFRTHALAHASAHASAHARTHGFLRGQISKPGVPARAVCTARLQTPAHAARRPPFVGGTDSHADAYSHAHARDGSVFARRASDGNTHAVHVITTLGVLLSPGSDVRTSPMMMKKGERSKTIGRISAIYRPNIGLISAFDRPIKENEETMAEAL